MSYNQQGLSNDDRGFMPGLPSRQARLAGLLAFSLMLSPWILLSPSRPIFANTMPSLTDLNQPLDAPSRHTGNIPKSLWLSKKRLQAIVDSPPLDNTVVFDRHGSKLAELFTDSHEFIPYSEIPATLIQAILAIEDRRFWRHPGVDVRGMSRAFFVGLQRFWQRNHGFYTQGGSTLTQQLARHWFLPNEKSFRRKFFELLFALQIERQLSKEKILELYANQLFLGHGSTGVGAAAQRYFGRPLAKLKTHEFALLAGLFQSPSSFNPHRHPERAKRRQLAVLKAMAQAGFLTATQCHQASVEPLVYVRPLPNLVDENSYFVEYAAEQARSLLGILDVKNQGLRITTTLDSPLQQAAIKAVAAAAPQLDSMAKTIAKDPAVRANPELGRIEKIQAAILSTDPRQGDILTMVGGRRYLDSQFNRTVAAMRQPGSVLKPVIYSLALLQGWRLSDVIYVSPVTIADSYRPRTPKADFLSTTTLLRALYRSMNTPTVELGEKLGLFEVIAHAKNLGISTPLKEEFGTMLGASETTLLDLARVMGVFAAEGQRIDPVAILEIRDRTGHLLYQRPAVETRVSQALPPSVAFLMVQAMRQVLLRGTGARAASWANWAAGKTGTSNDSKDNWFAGLSTDLVTICWVGHDDALPLPGFAQGSSLALPIWQDFMKFASQHRPQSLPFPPPKDVHRAFVDPVDGQVSSQGVEMWFLAGDGPYRRGTIKRQGRFESLRDPL